MVSQPATEVNSCKLLDAAMYSAACVGADETVAANRPGCPLASDETSARASQYGTPRQQHSLRESRLCHAADGPFLWPIRRTMRMLSACRSKGALEW